MIIKSNRGITLRTRTFLENLPYKKPQLWLVLLKYSADVASDFPWVVTYGIRANPVIPCGHRDTTPQSGP